MACFQLYLVDNRLTVYYSLSYSCIRNQLNCSVTDYANSTAQHCCCFTLKRHSTDIEMFIEITASVYQKMHLHNKTTVNLGFF